MIGLQVGPRVLSLLVVRRRRIAAAVGVPARVKRGLRVRERLVARVGRSEVAKIEVPPRPRVGQPPPRRRAVNELSEDGGGGDCKRQYQLWISISVNFICPLKRNTNTKMVCHLPVALAPLWRDMR